jgi:putative phosphoesterase
VENHFFFIPLKMKKIGIISDTHCWLEPKAAQYFADCDEIWHAGDFGCMEVAEALQKIKPLRGVYGNIDGQQLRTVFSEYLVFNLEGFKILMIHIGGYPGKYSPAARKLIQSEKPDIFVCGHSHILKVMRDAQHNNMLVINPGAAGREGFHIMKTIIKMELDNGTIKNIVAVELGKRGG